MSTQSDFNNYYPYFILYYCNSPAGQNDQTVYNQDLSNVCTIAVVSNNVQINTWLIGSYSAPSMPTLLSYTISNVLAFYNNFYTIPQAIKDKEPYMISTSDLALIRVDSSMIGYIVYDLTAKVIKSWTGSSWSASGSQYLSLGGGTLSGDLNMGANKITNIRTLYQSIPSAISVTNSSSGSISFTANTPQVVSLSGFSQNSNPGSDFTLDTSTGKITYNGSTTRWFQVSSNYAVSTLVPISTQTLTMFLSKNSSTSISGPRNVHSFIALLGLAYTYSESLQNVIQLAQNDTIQLAGNYTATAGVTIGNISLCVSQI